MARRKGTIGVLPLNKDPAPLAPGSKGTESAVNNASPAQAQYIRKVVAAKARSGKGGRLS